MPDPVPAIGPTEEPPNPAAEAGLPPTWSIVEAVQVLYGPLDIGQTVPKPTFARTTTTVRDSRGDYVSSSGDYTDAVNIALGLCQARMPGYDPLAWPFP